MTFIVNDKVNFYNNILIIKDFLKDAQYMAYEYKIIIFKLTVTYRDRFDSKNEERLEHKVNIKKHRYAQLHIKLFKTARLAYYFAKSDDKMYRSKKQKGD